MNVSPEAFVEKLGKEDAKARKYFYLITFFRILLGTLSALGSGLRDVATLTRKQIATAVRKAFDDPVAPGRLDWRVLVNGRLAGSSLHDLVHYSLERRPLI